MITLLEAIIIMAMSGLITHYFLSRHHGIVMSIIYGTVFTGILCLMILSAARP